MEKIAINIALLLPKDASEQSIAINRQLTELSGLDNSALRLNLEDRVPHITVLQGVVIASDLLAICNIVEEKASRAETAELSGSFSGGREASLNIAYAEWLQNLHENIAEKCQPFIQTDVRPEYFYGSGVTKFNLNYVANFFGQSAFDNYKPHITLLPGNKRNFVFEEVQLNFKPRSVAVGRLGGSGTFRKVLYEKSI